MMWTLGIFYLALLGSATLPHHIHSCSLARSSSEAVQASYSLFLPHPFLCTADEKQILADMGLELGLQLSGGLVPMMGLNFWAVLLLNFSFKHYFYGLGYMGCQ